MSYIAPGMEGMLDTFLFETTSLLDQLDEIMLECEKVKSISTEHINEIFRIMHTTKGSAAMMGLDSMSRLAHAVEDVFFIIREDPAKMQSVNDELFDLVFQASDYLRGEIEGLQQDVEGYQPADTAEMMGKLENLAAAMKGEAAPAAAAASAAAPAPAAAVPDGFETVRVFFEEDCQMENIRAFMLMNQLKDYCDELDSDPKNPENDSSLAAGIVKNGFIIRFKPAGDVKDVYRVIESALNVKSYETLSTAAAASAAPAAAPAAADGVHTVRVFFEEDCQMENIRAFMLLTQLKDLCEELDSDPKDPEKNSDLCKQIVEKGFLIKFKCAGSPDPVYQAIGNALNVKSFEKLDTPAAAPAAAPGAPAAAPKAAPAAAKPVKQSLISVNQAKLDHLMDLVGEIVTAESMVSANPDLRGLQLENFSKATRELRKLTDELQDVVMSMRMVPISGVFQKMHRIVRDMCKKLGKEVELVTVGGDTEVDKTINDSITDPFMHMVRNSVDHGIEMPDERAAKGKDKTGKVTLSAQNAGGEIIITIADDGAGLDRDKILAKAKKNGILTKPEHEYTDKEIYGMIMMPGFSTNDKVTEFSGRGVGMDVVRKNLENVGGTVSVDSKPGEGSVFTIKIPLTLAIVDGMGLMVGGQLYILPIASIRQSFKISDPSQIIHDTDGAEMIMLRGQCYPVIRLHEAFDVPSAAEKLEDGILVLTETDHGAACLFADELIGEQQVVVKPFPSYLAKYGIKERGLSGCSIMGDGTISLIIDAVNLINQMEGR